MSASQQRHAVYVVTANADGTSNIASIPVDAQGTAFTVGPLNGQVTVAVAPSASPMLYAEHREASTDRVEAYAPGSPQLQHAFDVRAHAGPVRLAADAQNRIYVPGGLLNTIDVYAGLDGTHLSTLTAPVNDPVCVAIGGDGTIYVGGHDPETVAAVPAQNGATTPSPITTFDGPIRGLAVDRFGTVYVATGLPTKGSVEIFPAGATAPSARLLVNGPSDVAVDATNALYVATSDDTIDVFPPGASAPGTVLPLTGTPDSLAI